MRENAMLSANSEILQVINSVLKKGDREIGRAHV